MQKNILNYIKIFILLQLLLINSPLFADDELTQTPIDKEMIIDTDSRLYLFNAPYQEADSIKIDKHIGNTILIGPCDQYGWCPTETGYVKAHLLREKEQVKTDDFLQNNTNPNITEKEKTEIQNIKQVEKSQNPITPTTQKDKSQLVTKQTTEPIITQDILPTDEESIFDDFFLSLSAGVSSMSVSQNNITGSTVLETKPDDMSFNIEVALGYRFNEDSFSTLSISYIEYDDVTNYNYLGSYNRIFFNTQTLKPYIGVLAGISSLELTKSSVNGKITDAKNSIFAYGVQIGLEQELSNHFRIFAQFQYLKAEQTTSFNLLSGEFELTRDHYLNLNAGMRYEF